MIKDVFDLTLSVGKLLHFPDGLCEASFTMQAPGQPVTGLLTAAPSLLHVSNPLDRLPREAITWFAVRCTAKGFMGWPASDLGKVNGPQMRIVIKCINALETIRENERLDSFANRSEPRAKYDARSRLEKEKRKLCQEVIQSNMQPCQILLNEGPEWIWVHPEDVMTFPEFP